MKLTRRFLTGSTLAVLALLFLAAVLLTNTVFRGARLDLTANNLYTLSEGTRNILGKIDEPINLYFYYSDKGTQDIPMLRTYATRVRELLEEMTARAGGKIKLSVIDPLPFSEDEDTATGYGLQSVPAGSTGESIFFGLAGTNAVDGQVIIPFFQPDKELFLEYDVAKLIHQLGSPKKAVVGLISSLDLGAGFDAATRQMREPWAIVTQMEQLFEVRQINAAGVTSIDPEISVLALVHPKELSDAALYAIDQFVLRGGHLLVFVDPNSELDQSGADPNNPSAAMFADKSSNLARLFQAWGLDFAPDQIVLDRGNALSISTAPGAPPVRHPAILGFGAEDMNPDDVTTAQLGTVNASTAGYFKLVENSEAKLVPLIQSSDDAMAVPTDRIRFVQDPSELFQGYTPSGERYVVAGRLQGTLKTAFPEKTDAGHLAVAAAPVEVLVVADTDVLSDRLWVQVSQFFGQKILNAFANNGDFAVNAVDNLTGSSDLISIRGRATSQRPFTTVEALKRAADEKFRLKEQELQGQLAETERKLNDLQTSKSQENAMILSPEQKTELARFQADKLKIRKELRKVRRDLAADIEALGTRLKLLNIGLVPLLLTLAALLFAGWRNKRRQLV